MRTFLRPYRSPLLFALFGIVCLGLLALIRPDLRWLILPTPEPSTIAQESVGRANQFITGSISQLPTHPKSEFAEFSSTGERVDWSDRFRPIVPGDERNDIDSTLFLIRNQQAVWINLRVNTDSGYRIYQSAPFPTLEGPYRFYASGIEDVAWFLGQAESLPLGIHSFGFEVNGTPLGYLVSDGAPYYARQKMAVLFPWIWTTVVTFSLIVFVFWMRSISSSRQRNLLPAAFFVLLPELVIRTQWAEHAAMLIHVPFGNDALWGLWVRAICYVVAVLLLSDVLLRVKRLYGFIWYPRTIGFSAIYGVLSGFTVIGLSKSLYRISISEPFHVLGIDVLPDLSTLSLYVGGAFLSASALLAILLFGWFLMNTETDRIRWMHLFSALGFLYSLSVGFTITVSQNNWVILISALTGLILYASTYLIHRKPELVREISPFRQLLLGVTILSMFMYPIFYMANQNQYDQGLTRLAELTAKDGIASDRSFGLQSPFRIAIYEDGERLEMFGDYMTGQFNDRLNLHEAYVDMRSGDVVRREVGGHYFTYQEVASKSDDTVAVVSARIQNPYNHMFAFFRLMFILLGLAMIGFPIVRFITGNKISLFRGRERFEYRILDTYIISSFLFLLILVIMTRQIILRQNASDIELELIAKLELLSEPFDSGTAVDIDYFYYENGLLADFSEVYPYEGILPTVLIPKSIYDILYESGQDRGIHRIDSPIGTLLIAFKKLDDARVLAIPANLNANKYMDEILQTTSFSIIIYLFIFGLFIGGTVFITRELMHPIHQFQQGLHRISAGQLDTLIPVTSKDEIGELANAYNLMVFKLKDLQNELADKERQSAWAEMARQVAHEIKNPLTPMKLSIQHLYQQILFGDKTMDEVKPMISRISETLIREIDSLNNIANDFSKFARPITEDFAVVNLNDSITSILNLYKHDRRMYLWADLSDQALPIYAAPDEIKRVLLNLVKNAMEALPRGGLVAIRTYSYRDHAYVEVIDNGSGIEDELKTRIFIPNFSTKSTGTGLGLAICKKVVETHKGHIEFASAQGMGTTFTIRFPLTSVA